MTAKNQIAAKLKELSKTIDEDDGNGQWAHDPALFAEVMGLIEIHKIDMRRAKPRIVPVLGESTPVVEAPKVEAPVVDAPVMEAPVVDAPVVVEAPKVEAKHEEKHAKTPAHKVKHAKAGPSTDENNNA